MILSFSYSSIANAALSATTANTIQGTAPAISFNGGTTVAADTKELLGFTMPNGSGGTIKITSLQSTAIEAKPTYTFNDFVTQVTADDTAYTLPSSYYYDKDGDTPDATTPVAGTLKATWTYKDLDGYTTKTLTPAELSGNFDACKAPYTLTIAASGVTVKSAYGDPNINSYSNQTKAYTVKVADYKKCYIKPAYLTVNTSCTSSNCKYASGYNSAVFVPNGGFLPDAVPAFPTVGFNKAKFTLKMSNLQSDYTYNSSNSTIAPIDSIGVVTLNSASRPSLPLSVTLTATPTNHLYPAQTYSFSITKWPKAVLGTAQYNTVTNFSGTYPAATLCDPTLSSLSGSASATQAQAAAVFYSRAELTNSPYATGTANGGYFSRDIDGTFNGEWGSLINYTNSGFGANAGVWTSDAVSPTRQFSENSASGTVYAYAPSVTLLTVCR